jgi:hypothetical protein
MFGGRHNSSSPSEDWPLPDAMVLEQLHGDSARLECMQNRRTGGNFTEKTLRAFESDFGRLRAFEMFSGHRDVVVTAAMLRCMYADSARLELLRLGIAPDSPEDIVNAFETDESRLEAVALHRKQHSSAPLRRYPFRRVLSAFATDVARNAALERITYAASAGDVAAIECAERVRSRNTSGVPPPAVVDEGFPFDVYGSGHEADKARAILASCAPPTEAVARPRSDTSLADLAREQIADQAERDATAASSHRCGGGGEYRSPSTTETTTTSKPRTEPFIEPVAVDAETEKREGRRGVCVACLEYLATRVAIPCGHLCYCETCGKTANEAAAKVCPLCRAGIQQLMKVTLS